MGDKTENTNSYLERLLQELLRDPEGFSGKRPFGNSGWIHELYECMAKDGMIEVTYDEYGHVDEVPSHADSLLSNHVSILFAR